MGSIQHTLVFQLLEGALKAGTGSVERPNFGDFLTAVGNDNPLSGPDFADQLVTVGCLQRLAAQRNQPPLPREARPNGLQVRSRKPPGGMESVLGLMFQVENPSFEATSFCPLSSVRKARSLPSGERKSAQARCHGSAPLR